MHHLIILMSLIFTTLLRAQTAGSTATISLAQLELSEEQKGKIKKGEFFVSSKVHSEKKETDTPAQKLDFAMAGLHPNTCTQALRKLARYENYKDYLEFIDESSYDEQSKYIRWSLSTHLLPFKMIMKMKLPRISEPGYYPFEFEGGFLAGLLGKISVTNEGNSCFFYVSAHWQGPDSGLNDTVFEIFTSTLARLGMEKLFRISRI